MWIFVVSAALNAAYFLPPVYAMWFGQAREAPEPAPSRIRPVAEAPPALLAPPVLTAGMSLLVGVLAAAPYAPLAMARFIAEGVFPV